MTVMSGEQVKFTAKLNSKSIFQLENTEIFTPDFLEFNDKEKLEELRERIDLMEMHIRWDEQDLEDQKEELSFLKDKLQVLSNVYSYGEIK